MIAAAYSKNGDLGRARSRLVLLGDENSVNTLTSQAQLTLAEGGSEESARALGLLAAALSTELTPNTVAGLVSTPTPGGGAIEVEGSQTSVTTGTTTGTLEITVSPAATNTPTLTITPTATQGALFTLREFSPQCNADVPGPLIQVFVKDAAGRPVPGVEVVVSWEGGEDVFYTGLKPEIDLGYADFEMELEVFYTVGLTLGDQLVPGFIAIECETEGGEQTYSSWEIIFVQP
ncbi:MAG: hypothetical protein IH859_06895 [Chloroflexi bacterium]|nr:hypothetical protein [Chloroflexota bacterium]